VFIKRKRERFNLYALLVVCLTKEIVAFYRDKQKRRGGADEMFVEAVKISPAEGETIVISGAILVFLTMPFHPEIAICKLLITSSCIAI
jgi:hypothetical protein